MADDKTDEDLITLLMLWRGADKEGKARLMQMMIDVLRRPGKDEPEGR